MKSGNNKNWLINQGYSLDFDIVKTNFLIEHTVAGRERELSNNARFERCFCYYMAMSSSISYLQSSSMYGHISACHPYTFISRTPKWDQDA